MEARLPNFTNSPQQKMLKPTAGIMPITPEFITPQPKKVNNKFLK
jgi:hypothetical protein